MQALSKKAKFAQDFVDLREATGIPDASWEAFQIAYLNNTTRFGIDVKARQIAWSFTSALDAVIDSILNDNAPHIFVSINQDEAQEKIRYANSIYDAIHPLYKPGIIRQSQTIIEFSNRSRLISHPCKPVRGKAQTRVYLDEMAHYGHELDRQIYLAALPSTIKGGGYMRIGSSPLGARGLFWEIATESIKQFPGYKRSFIPWWEVNALCNDIDKAKQDAPLMSTEERVIIYGTRPLIEIFENMFLEDFQQEYECAWVDEATAWISWEVIQRNQRLDHFWFRAKSTQEAKDLIPKLRNAVKEKQIEHVLYGGIDVGRTRNLTELVLIGKGITDVKPLRLLVSLDRVEYQDQEDCLAEIINNLPIAQVLVDNNGIGAQLAENLRKRTGKAKEYPFTNASKELLAVEIRIEAERGQVLIPNDRDLAYQIHSIKKSTTAAKNNVYDSERNTKHHADQFWAWALAVYASKSVGVTWDDIAKADLGHVEGYRESKPWA